MFDDLLFVWAPGVTFHVLRERDELFLIDTGFLGGLSLLRRALRRRGWESLPIRRILLTHGHLDHIWNAAAIAREWRCPISAPRLDALHYSGRYPYRGPAVVCGMLEATGRALFRFQPFTVDQEFEDGCEFAIWGGLRAVHLPGHTAGHTGFYCPSRRLLFSGDLFASHGGVTCLPPAIFNSCPALIPASLAKAAALELDGVVPNHADGRPPEKQLARLRALLARRMRKSTAD